MVDEINVDVLDFDDGEFRKFLNERGLKEDFRKWRKDLIRKK